MRYLITILNCFLLLSVLAQTPKKKHRVRKPVVVEAQADSVQKDSLIAFAKKQLGTNYCYANCSPEKGFDCSGFVYYVFSHFHIRVPRSSIDYKNFGTPVSEAECKPGDVIVFTGTDPKKRSPGHVGIVISEPGEKVRFIHSSSSKKEPGVKISNLDAQPSYRERFIKIVRVAVVD